MKTETKPPKSYLEADSPEPVRSGYVADGAISRDRFSEFREWLIQNVMPVIPTSGPNPLRKYDELFPESRPKDAP